MFAKKAVGTAFALTLIGAATLTGCSMDSTDEPKVDTMQEQEVTEEMTTEMDPAANLVGPGCAAYAEAVPDGAGSIIGMSQDPVAVAASNNPLLTTLVSAVSGQLNPDVDLPDLAIVAVHRSDKSGTTGNFTDYLGAAAPDAWPAGSVEEWPSDISGGEAAQGTSGVVEAVKGGVGTIGYADASRADGLSTVKVKVGEEFVAYSPEAAAAIVDASPLEEGRTAGDLAIKLDRASSAEGVYPIVLISYLVACGEYEDAANAELVKEYFSYIVSEEGQKDAEAAAGSAPISDTLREQAVAAIDSIS